MLLHKVRRLRRAWVLGVAGTRFQLHHARSLARVFVREIAPWQRLYLSAVRYTARARACRVGVLLGALSYIFHSFFPFRCQFLPFRSARPAFSRPRRIQWIIDTLTRR